MFSFDELLSNELTFPSLSVGSSERGFVRVRGESGLRMSVQGVGRKIKLIIN